MKPDVEKEIKFEVQITEEDYYSFHQAVFPRKSRVTLWMVAAIFLTLIVVELSQEGLKALVHTAYMWIFVVLPFILHFTVKKSIRKSFDNNPLTELKHYTAANEVISYNATSSSMRTEWKEIKRVVETNSIIALFFATNAAHVIPVRSFANQDDLAAFQRLIVTNIPLSIRKPPKERKVIARIGIYLLIFVVTVVVVRFLSQ